MFYFKYNRLSYVKEISHILHILWDKEIWDSVPWLTLVTVCTFTHGGKSNWNILLRYWRLESQCPHVTSLGFLWSRYFSLGLHRLFVWGTYILGSSLWVQIPSCKNAAHVVLGPVLTVSYWSALESRCPKMKSRPEGLWSRLHRNGNVWAHICQTVLIWGAMVKASHRNGDAWAHIRQPVLICKWSWAEKGRFRPQWSLLLGWGKTLNQCERLDSTGSTIL